MSRFSDSLETQGENECLTQKVILNGKEICENINTKSMNDTETEHISVENPLIMHNTASNETTLVSEIPNIINEENLIMAPRQKMNQFQLFSYLLFVGKFGYNNL